MHGKEILLDMHWKYLNGKKHSWAHTFFVKFWVNPAYLHNHKVFNVYMVRLNFMGQLTLIVSYNILNAFFAAQSETNFGCWNVLDGLNLFYDTFLIPKLKAPNNFLWVTDRWAWKVLILKSNTKTKISTQFCQDLSKISS